MATELIKIDEVKNILSSFPDIIGRNTSSVKKCNEAGQTLLDTIEGEGMNEAIDQAAADYLKKVSVTIKNMDERRKPITQILIECVPSSLHRKKRLILKILLQFPESL